LRIAKPEISDELKQACSKSELAEVQRWIEVHHAGDLLKAEFAARTLAEQLELANQWFTANAESSTARTVVSEVLPQWNTLRATLKRKAF